MLNHIKEIIDKTGSEVHIAVFVSPQNKRLNHVCTTRTCIVCLKKVPMRISVSLKIWLQIIQVENILLMY